MILKTVINNALWAFRYPSFPKETNGDYQVGALQARIPGRNGPACQIHYPTRDESGDKLPYFRTKAVEGVANYTRQTPDLLQFLSQRAHPCAVNAEPIIGGDGFPVVIFSHGLGGCMEMYTSLCQQIASEGFLVFAIEHEDGSGAYAETSDGEPIFYRRPDDSPYCREKVTDFRGAFLDQRVEEIRTLMDFLDTKAGESHHDESEGDDKDTSLFYRILLSADTRTISKPHLIGHSFGGATVVRVIQELQDSRCESASVLDCWAFSLSPVSIERGIQNTPFLSILSEAWLTNPETVQVDKLLQSSSKTAQSFFVRNAVHASFSDSIHWLPGVVTRQMGLRGANEDKHTTIKTSAKACVQHMKKRFIDNANLLPYKFTHVDKQEQVENEVSQT